MFPLKLTKFGKRPDAANSHDTPVTRLSKILSKTSFEETSNVNYPGCLKLSSISEVIPTDLDESANQEPPLKNCLSWFEGCDNFPQANATTKPFTNLEFSNSCSSGYFSASTTQSAPPTCTSERVLECFSAELPDFTNPSFNHPQRFNFHKSPVSDAVCTGSSTLRRTQSCTARGWLAKRHRRQNWPRISGILRCASASISPAQLADTNSCPAALPTDCLTHQQGSLIRRYSLPPVGELGLSSDESPPPRSCAFAKFSLSPETNRSPGSMDSSFECSSRPQAKKQRVDLPIPGSPDDSCRSPQADLDSTVPIEDESVEDVPGELVGKPATSVELHPKPAFGMFRHHSTPMVPMRSIGLTVACSVAPSPMQTTVAKQPRLHLQSALTRCASVPARTISEKLSHCISVLDNPNFRCDVKRHRALPVVQRTDSGLHCVSIDTVADLVSDSHEKRNISYVIVDCRFPYEYEGGHIRGAVNIFTHSDLVQEIFNRVPAQRPPGKPGPPKLLGEGLSRRLAVAPKEPLSAPCEPVSEDDDSEDDADFGHFTSEASQLELAAAQVGEENNSNNANDASGPLDSNLSDLSSTTSCSGSSGPQEPAFVVIFHCEFSSQRAPDLATFLRNVDRMSNYHRYPFLYFPEIYIMKGGYSAFFQNYSHLCSPGNYVKMSHRDYQTHFRLYKRLTKRVSSACMACIRPQHKLLDSPVVDSMNSFGQPSEFRDSMIVPPVSAPLLNIRSQQAPVLLGGEATVPTATYEDKENVPCDVSSNDLSVHSTGSGSSSSFRDSPVLPPVESPVSRRSSSSADSSLNGSPLSLAEAVVRVGRRVIAATLGTADPSLGIGQLLEKFQFQVPTTQVVPPTVEPSCVRGPLKRSKTVTDMCNVMMLVENRQIAGDSKRVPLRTIIHNPFALSDELSGLQTTPAALSRKRANTLTCTPLNSMAPRSSSHNPTETPVAPSRNCKPFAYAPPIDATIARLSHSLSTSPVQPS
ncbi:hypothetical protein P879_01658 [Paragonimus westermani]|uniref:Rhodanese domain-containing protein n=1 Tax=Paragonimus westermani TaxID=34504 RepID=A0A8T0D276_9TREM|nr:hypothetical protein P879_01658 [Paragonimus westermani]